MTCRRHDGPGAAAEDGTSRKAKDRRDTRDRRGAEYDLKADAAGERQGLPDRRRPPVGYELVRGDRERDGGPDQPGYEGEHADHNGLCDQDPAAPRARGRPWCGSCARRYSAVTNKRAERDQRDQAEERAEERDVQGVDDGLERRDVTEPATVKVPPAACTDEAGSGPQLTPLQVRVTLP